MKQLVVEMLQFHVAVHFGRGKTGGGVKNSIHVESDKCEIEVHPLGFYCVYNGHQLLVPQSNVQYAQVRVVEGKK